MCISLFTDPLFSLQSLSSACDRKEKHWGIYWPLRTHSHTLCVFKKNEERKEKENNVCVQAMCVWENFCLHNRILSLQQVAQNQIRQNLCNLSQGQNYIAETKISTKILQYTRSNMKPRHVIQLFAATYHLVCSNCYNNYQSSHKNQPRLYQNNLYWVEILSTL